jgi:hypothetical protein
MLPPKSVPNMRCESSQRNPSPNPANDDHIRLRFSILYLKNCEQRFKLSRWFSNECLIGSSIQSDTAPALDHGCFTSVTHVSFAFSLAPTSIQVMWRRTRNLTLSEGVPHNKHRKHTQKITCSALIFISHVLPSRRQPLVAAGPRRRPGPAPRGGHTPAAASRSA